MKISVTFRNTEGETYFRGYVDERLKKLKKYLDNPVEVHVVLSVEKFRNVAEINMSDNGLTFIAKEEAKDMTMAIDEAVEKIERQLKKHRERIRERKGGKGEREPAAASGEEIEEELAARVVETRRITLKPMSHEEAILELENAKNRFVVFRDAATEGICVLYRRDDGRYVLIETYS